MDQTAGNVFDNILQRVKYQPSRFESALAYTVINPLANIKLAIEMMDARNEEEDISLFVDVIKRNCMRINQLIIEIRPDEMPLIF